MQPLGGQGRGRKKPIDPVAPVLLPFRKPRHPFKSDDFLCIAIETSGYGIKKEA